MPQAPEEVLLRLKEATAETCRQAADAIAGAEVLLLCTGAGFSADSGLAVYADVARIDAYAARGLTYRDLCRPHWLDVQPETFWGFWGQCFNDYRDTAPHDGYRLIEGWVERAFRTSDVAEEIRAKLRESVRAGRLPELGEMADGSAYAVQEHAGAFFVFTSNVDAHHFDWFRAHEIHECHGNTEIYQCTGESCEGIWRAAPDFRFRVDQVTMLAPAGPPAELLGPAPAGAGAELPEKAVWPAAAEAEVDPARASGGHGAQAAGDEDARSADEGLLRSRLFTAGACCWRPDAAGAEAELTGDVVVPAANEAEREPPSVVGEGGVVQAAASEDSRSAEEEVREPRIGHVRGGGRPRLLRHMPPGGTSPGGVDENHPKCPTCGAVARPAVLMFGDSGWHRDMAQLLRYRAWRKAVQSLASERAGSPAGPLRMAILEIGAGDNVPTVRHASEGNLLFFLQAGADARLIRVNPDLPTANTRALLPDGDHHARLISIMADGLASVSAIDEGVQARYRSQSKPCVKHGPDADQEG